MVSCSNHLANQAVWSSGWWFLSGGHRITPQYYPILSLRKTRGIYRLINGIIDECWLIDDFLGLYYQHLPALCMLNIMVVCECYFSVNLSIESQIRNASTCITTRVCGGENLTLLRFLVMSLVSWCLLLTLALFRFWNHMFVCKFQVLSPFPCGSHSKIFPVLFLHHLCLLSFELVMHPQPLDIPSCCWWVCPFPVSAIYICNYLHLYMPPLYYIIISHHMSILLMKSFFVGLPHWLSP